jgi:hypothetical protein
MRALLLLAIACGDPLVESGYRGEPLLTFEGLITDMQFSGRIEQLSLSIFWTRDNVSTTDPDQLIEQSGLSVSTTFPAIFTVRIFNPPSQAISEKFASGLILVYEDEDGDRRMSQGELRGGATNNAVVYVPAALSAAESPTGETMEAGYHLARIPMPCGFAVPGPIHGDESCGANLGASCESNGECTGPAICRTELPNGYCTIPYSNEACRPRDGVLFDSWVFTTTSTEGPPFPGLDWYLTCDSDEECRVEDGYSCPFWLGACYPTGPVRIELFSNFMIAQVCNFVP